MSKEKVETQRSDSS